MQQLNTQYISSPPRQSVPEPFVSPWLGRFPGANAANPAHTHRLPMTSGHPPARHYSLPSSHAQTPLRPKYNSFHQFSKPGSGLPTQIVAIHGTPVPPSPTSTAQHEGHTHPHAHHGDVELNLSTASFEPRWQKIVTGIGKAGLLVTGALLLKLLPARMPIGGKSLLPVDWKAWAKIILGIAATNQINHAFDYKPKPWINGIQAVAMITAITQPFNKLSTLKHFVLMAPLVAGMVQSAVYTNEKINPILEEKWNIPPIIPQLLISTLMIIFGAKLSTRILKAAGMETAGVATVTCHNGCSPGSMICLSEAGEMAGSLRNWIKDHWFHRKQNGSNSSSDHHSQPAGRFPS